MGETAVLRVGSERRVTTLALESEPVDPHGSAWKEGQTVMATRAVAVEPWSSFVRSRNSMGSWHYYHPWMAEMAIHKGRKGCCILPGGRPMAWLNVTSSLGDWWVCLSRHVGSAAAAAAADTWRAWKAWQDLQMKPSNR